MRNFVRRRNSFPKAGMNLFDSFNYAMSTTATGGLRRYKDYGNGMESDDAFGKREII